MDRDQIRQLYAERFSEKEIQAKNKIWLILCEYFFKKYIKEVHSVVDIGAGYCEFLNNIKAREKIAVDINPDTKKYAGENVRVISEDFRELTTINEESIDIVFSSNFLEHLSDKNEIIQILKKANRILKKGGLIILLGPNYKYLYREYWDFFDHKIPLTDKSITEILHTLDFSIKKSYARFLPYTTKSRIPKFSFLIRIYLFLPFLFKIFGKQFLIIGRKP